MDKINKFEDLDCWKYGNKVVIEIYQLTTKFPKEEIFGITNQLRRAAVSITSNIAECFGRFTSKDRAHFYQMSNGSIEEIKNLLIISKQLNFIELKDFDQLMVNINNTQGLLKGLLIKTRAK